MWHLWPQSHTEQEGLVWAWQIWSPLFSVPTTGATEKRQRYRKGLLFLLFLHLPAPEKHWCHRASDHLGTTRSDTNLELLGGPKSHSCGFRRIRVNPSIKPPCKLYPNLYSVLQKISRAGNFFGGWTRNREKKNYNVFFPLFSFFDKTTIERSKDLVILCFFF